MVVTRPDFPANDVRELVALAKADPGRFAPVSPLLSILLASYSSKSRG
jgi:hypothetical protein